MADFQLIFSVEYSKGLNDFTVTYQKTISSKELNTCYLPIYLYTIYKMRIYGNLHELFVNTIFIDFNVFRIWQLGKAW